MTREEVLSLLNKHKDDDVANVKVIKEFVNEIFDYFEPKMKELEEMHKIACELQKSRDKAYAYLEEYENRSCENCKHCITGINDLGIALDCNLGYECIRSSFILDDKWEKKDE